MELSLQEFCETTRHMIDKELPPSSMFCVPDTQGSKVMVTPGGDLLPCECAADCTSVRIFADYVTALNVSGNNILWV